MMRSLFLCMLLLRAVVSEEGEGSGCDGRIDDDEDAECVTKSVQSKNHQDSLFVDKAKGEDEREENYTMIIIIVAAVVMVLSVAAVVIILLVRRHMQSRQPGVYTVPTEQDQKVAV
ncbi:uncharacterized protein si:dkey-262k9.2 [Betta splendens]|uniref:Uncharacterized protein si:dkey-262k9.2 n=1 Tax=Betta splendens TaxID=158456 RepID=A0A8M1H5R7_BETSP|nr:uncharacterized protein si:dkey-262k9.2 [Betta splendens]